MVRSQVTRARSGAEGKPKLFKDLAFDQPLPAAGDAAVESTVRELYRRLLARDPTGRTWSMSPRSPLLMTTALCSSEVRT